jgi:hypothetical protein
MAENHGDGLLMLVQENQRAMDRVFEELGRFGKSLGEVREKLAAQEASSVQPQVVELRQDVSSMRERIAVLEGDRTARAEVAKSTGKQMDWAYRLAPWLFLTAYVVYTAVTRSVIV